MIGELTNHLWQSTVFAVVLGLLTIALRKNRAQVRYGVWFSASLKFFIPFSLLMTLGGQLEWAPPPGSFAAQIATPSVSYTMGQITQPFPRVLPTAPAVARNAMTTAAEWAPLVMLGVWMCGFVAIALMRLGAWRRIRAVVRAGAPLEIPAEDIGARTEVRSCPGLLEPAVVGLLRPILLLPVGIVSRLTPRQMTAVLAHELCHVRRRDNLTATIHMVVEAIFWFHPLVWWIGTRLVEERERACDEEVLRLGNDPQIYAEGILNVCKFYQESPLVCMSGVTGSNLRRRVEDIMRNRIGHKLSFSRAILLMVVGVTALAGPVAIGVIHATAGRAQHAPQTPAVAIARVIGEQFPATGASAQTQAPQRGARSSLQSPSQARPTFEVASIRPSGPMPEGQRGGPHVGCTGGPNQIDGHRFVATNKTLFSLVTIAYGTPGRGCGTYSQNDLLSGGPEWTKSDEYDVQAVIPEGSPSYTQQQFNNGQAPNLQVMLQTLLEDRFKLVLHREMKEMPVYALTLAKGGPKRTTSNAGDNWIGQDTGLPGFLQTPGQKGISIETRRPGELVLWGRKTSMSNLASALVSLTGTSRPVVDRTGLTGEFDFDLDGFASSIYNYNGAPTPRSIFNALEEELGLKLEATRAPIEVLVIDRAEKPSEN